MSTAITNKRFTLIEILIGILISSVLMAGIYSVFTAQIRVNTTQEQIAIVQQNIRSAMYTMEREIRMAGYQGNIAANAAGAGFTTATATTMTFTYAQDNDGIDNDGDGETDETGELTTIAYALYDEDADGDNDDLGRTVDNDPATLSPIANNIEAVEFLYNAGLPSQSLTPALNLIESVTITILARSARAIPNTATGRLYTTPAGIIWGDDEDYDDGLYRRYITSRVICRNL